MPILGLLEYQAIQRLLAANLEQRVAALEAQGNGAPQPLAEINETRQADVKQLREAIAAILEKHLAPATLTAKQLGKLLARAGFDPVPPERTLRRHLTAVRSATATR